MQYHITIDSYTDTYNYDFIDNVAPTDITLSPNTIQENQSINTTVGTLSSTDADVGNTFTYTLVSGTGSIDNASFNISGNLLRSSITFNYETKSSYTIRIRTTDNGGLYFEKQFTVNITNVPILSDSIYVNINGELQYRSYDMNFTMQSGSASPINSQDIRFRTYMNHHFASLINSLVTGYIPVASPFTINATEITSTHEQDIWKSNTRPPMIGDVNFCQEDSFYLNSGAVLSSGNVITDCLITYTGRFNNQIKNGRFDDVASSYSYTGDSVLATPEYILFEVRDNTKTKTIKSVTQVNNLITVITTVAHGYTTGMGVRLTGIPLTDGVKYNGNYKITVTSGNSFTCVTNSVTTALSYTTGNVEVWNVLSGVAPSSALGVNYLVNPVTAPIDHTINTFLVYPEKDTVITNTQSLDYGWVNEFKVVNKTNSVSKSVFKFPVGSVVNVKAPFTSELNVFNNYAENARHTAFAIKQMTSDTWKEVDQWNVINPMIGSVIDSYTYDQKTKDTDESVYTKFETTSSVTNWLNGSVPCSISLEKNNVNDYNYEFLSRDGDTVESMQYKPYLLITGDSEVLVPKTQPTFTISPEYGYVGDVVTLNILTGDINNDITKNKVVFNGV